MRGGRRRDIDWSATIERQRTSGLSIEAFSKAEGFSSASFYLHRKRLQENGNKIQPVSPPTVRGFARPTPEVHALINRCLSENRELRDVVVELLLENRRLKAR